MSLRHITRNSLFAVYFFLFFSIHSVYSQSLPATEKATGTLTETKEEIEKNLNPTPASSTDNTSSNSAESSEAKPNEPTNPAAAIEANKDGQSTEPGTGGTVTTASDKELEIKETPKNSVVVAKDKPKPVKKIKKKPAAPRPSVQVNAKNQALIKDQLVNAPEDASFLYETRYIPDYGESNEFLPAELEQEVIVETIERQSASSFQVQLPNMIQASVIAGIIALFLLYKRSVRKSVKGRRYGVR